MRWVFPIQNFADDSEGPRSRVEGGARDDPAMADRHVRTYGGGWVLKQEVHDWFMRNQLDYHLGWMTEFENWWHVEFEADDETAMLIKLRWCS